MLFRCSFLVKRILQQQSPLTPGTSLLELNPTGSVRVPYCKHVYPHRTHCDIRMSPSSSFRTLYVECNASVYKEKLDHWTVTKSELISKGYFENVLLQLVEPPLGGHLSY